MLPDQAPVVARRPSILEAVAKVGRTVRLAQSRTRLRLGPGPDPATLFEAFESLGDNCEFGFVKRAYGARTVGLFNFAATSVETLLPLLAARFEGLRSPDRMDLTVHIQGREYIVLLGAYVITFHAGVRVGEALPETVRLQQTRRVALLARKMVEDLETGAKIFVFRGAITPSRGQIDALADHLQAYGPVTLLWITPQEPGHPPGQVERLSDGLLHGYIDRFSPAINASKFSPTYWPVVCRNAYQLWRQPS